MSSTAEMPPWDWFVVLLMLGFGYFVIPSFLKLLLQLVLPTVSEPSIMLWQEWSQPVVWSGLLWGLYNVYKHQLTGACFKNFLGLNGSLFNISLLIQGIWATLACLLLTTLLSGLVHLMGWQVQAPYPNFPQAIKPSLVIFSVVVAPFFEEILFRGLLQTSFQKSRVQALSISPQGPGQFSEKFYLVLVSSAVFSFFHLSYWFHPLAWSYVFLLGVLFSWFRLKTNSIFPGWMAHTVNNVLASSWFWTA